MTSSRRVRVVRRNERGFALVYLAITIVVLMGIAAFALDVGNWFLIAQREQKAADTAALSGAIYLPGHFAQGSTNACQVASDNGYVDPSCGANGSTVQVAPVSGNPYQLQVTISQTVNNAFAGLIGYTSQTITRTAIAQYEAPVTMGSPANIFGNEPPEFGGQAWANVSFTPNLWANVMGPYEPKSDGDSQQADNCTSSSQDGCPANGQDNTDYSNDGYFYRVTVDPAQAAAHAGQHLAIEIFDPAMVAVGDDCNIGRLDVASGKTAPGPALNPYTSAADAPNRYSYGDGYTAAQGDGNTNDPTGTWCTGDNPNGTPPETTYLVRQDLNPYAPSSNPVVNQGGCGGEQFGYWTDPGGNGLYDELNQPAGWTPAQIDSSSYDPSLASVFRQWVPVCVFDPASAPATDYLVQVRTNIAPTASQAVMQGAPTSPQPNTAGSNRFAMRAAWVGGGALPVWTTYSANPKSADASNDPYVGGYQTGPLSFTDGTGLTMSGTVYMGLYANAASGAAAPNFFMARVLPGSQGQTLAIRLWDIGDCRGTNCHPTLTFKLPTGDGGGVPTCTIIKHPDNPATKAVIVNNGSCSYTVGSSGEDPNGLQYEIDIPIPANYTCVPGTATDCWFTMTYQVNGAGNALNDTTTWGANLEGNPVRLVK